MYLSAEELQHLLNGINSRFSNATIVFDAYSKQAVKSSKLKNPVNQMNAIIKWGMNNPSEFTILNENLYCSKISESLYKIYEFRLKNKEETER